MLEGGAYVPPYGLPDEVDNVLGAVSLFDATTAEIEVAIHRSSDASWDVLLNLLEGYSQATLRIVEVTLA